MGSGLEGTKTRAAMGLAALLLLLVSCQDSSAPSSERSSRTGAHPLSAARADQHSIDIEVFAPEEGHISGVNGIGWFVDLAIEFEGDLASTGFTGNQLSGPGIHENAAPFPGTFTPGKDDRFGGLISLIATIYFWPGDHQGPRANARRLAEANDEEEVVVVRVKYSVLLSTNAGAIPHFASCNSGSPRYSDGQPAARDLQVHRRARGFDRTPSQVVEVAFRDTLVLPADTEIAHDVTGPWKPLFNKT